MAAVTEVVVREYFEALGFLVLQPCKSHMAWRGRALDAVDLMAVNPTVGEVVMPEHFVWNGEDLKGIRAAVVGILGWHTDRMYASKFDQSPEIMRFVEPAVLKAATRAMGVSDGIARILCIPDLPASGAAREQSIEALRQKGIDGVLSFHTVLADLVSRVDKKANYEKSDVLQVIRLLKNYGLLQEGQLDLFARRSRAKT